MKKLKKINRHFKIGDKVVVVNPLCVDAERYKGQIGNIANIHQSKFGIWVTFESGSELNFEAEELIFCNKIAQVLYGNN